MKMQKQVNKEHYIFSNYLDKKRWSSLWHQLDEVSKLSPQSVLEVGPGPSIFKTNAIAIGLNVETVDLDPELKPDYIASATELPFEDQSYDVVCAFQMLEHLPFEQSLRAFSEMSRVANKNIVISLPDAKVIYPWRIYLPKMGVINFNFHKPLFKLKEHVFDGEHYWEINKKDYSLKKVMSSFLESAPDFELITNFRVSDNHYHRFLVFNRY